MWKNKQEELNNHFAWAASHGRLEEMKKLLEQGANPHWDADHALRYAAGAGQPEVVRYLLEHCQADPERIEYHGLRWAMDLKRPECFICVVLLYEACTTKPSPQLLWDTYRYNNHYDKYLELTRYLMEKDDQFFPYMIKREAETLWAKPENPHYQNLKNEYLIGQEKKKIEQGLNDTVIVNPATKSPPIKI